MILNFNMTDFYLCREYAWVCHMSYAKTNKEKQFRFTLKSFEKSMFYRCVHQMF